MTPRLLGLICALGAFALDQGTKQIALQSVAFARGLEVLPFFRLVLVRNDGVAFGMLGGFAPWWALAVLAAVIVAVLLVWLWRAADPWMAVSLGLIIGGALGNVADRLRHRAVTDFLDFFVGAYHWPAFNLADVAIFCGAGLMLLESLRDPQRAVPDREEGSR